MRLVLTAVGVALGVTVLLLAAAIDPAIRAHQLRTAWLTSGDAADADLQGRDGLLWHLDEDSVDGRRIVVLRVAGMGARAPLPVGLDHVPAPGELHVSPELARLLDDVPAARLADRFPEPPAGTIGDDYLGGPDDLIAVLGVAPAELAAQPGVVSVDRVRSVPETFGFSDVVRMLVAVAAVGVLLPILVFVGMSTRLGAARREQRFAALRLAGATPRQTTVLACIESGAVAIVGTLLGWVGYQLLRSPLARLQIDGSTSFITDVRVAPAWAAVILIGVPILAVATASVSLHRLRVSPLGVSRRAARTRPTARRVLPFVLGCIGFFVSFAVGRTGAGTPVLIALAVSFATMMYGIVIAGPWLTVFAARAVLRFDRRADTLLAARRLLDDPANGFRAVSGLVLAVFVVSLYSGISPTMQADNEHSAGVVRPSTLVVTLPAGTTASTAASVLRATADDGAGPGLVLHRSPRSSGADATGSTFVVVCAHEWAATPGAESCPPGATRLLEGVDAVGFEPAPYKAGDVRDLAAGALLISTDGSASTTDRVRTTVQKAVPGSSTRLGSESESSANRRLADVQRLANLALIVTLAVAGCSLAVSVAGGIIERRRPFTLLRLSGVHLQELRRVAMLEAAAPLLLIAGASAVLGVAVSAATAWILGGMPWHPPGLGYWASLAGGLILALALVASTLPLLGQATAPSSVQFE